MSWASGKSYNYKPDTIGSNAIVTSKKILHSNINKLLLDYNEF